MRGTVNEEAVLLILRRNIFIVDILDTGLLCIKEDNHLACSPDSILLTEVATLHESRWLESPEISVDGKSLWLAPIELKTKIAASKLGNHVHLSTGDVVFCSLKDSFCREYIPIEHIAQVFQQATVLCTRFSIYIVALETSIVYKNVNRISAAHRKVARSALNCVVAPTVT